jgi:hypothetical protein
LGKTCELHLQIYEILSPERGKELLWAMCRRGTMLSFIFFSGWRPGDEETANTTPCLYFDARFQVLLELLEGIQVPAVDCLLM